VSPPKTPRAGKRIKKPMQKRSIETRSRIIDAAKTLFAEKGFEDTTTNLIASQAGLSVGSVYVHFTNKWEIFHTILEDFSSGVFEYLKESVQKIIHDQNSLRDAVELLIHGLYKAHMLNGRLNAEIDRFTLMDAEAQKIRSRWEAKTNREILNLMHRFRGQIGIRNANAAVTVIHRSAHEVFQYLYKNRGLVDETMVLNEFVAMIRSYVVDRT
jgi:AcrR family transcriptional regulator